jgi:pyrroline-5-carboxylate reductase
VKTIAVIGAGQMGSALVRGMVSSGQLEAECIKVFDVDSAKVRGLADELGVGEASDLRDALAGGVDLVLLAVKPQMLGDVLDSIAEFVHEDLVLLSIAAGISTSFIASRLDRPVRIIRAMPNAASVVGKSATALCKGGLADEQDLAYVQSLFSAMGTAVVVPEKLINAVTGLASSGLAYVFVIMEALTDGGVRMGLDRPTSRALTVETLLGAATMAASGNQPFSDLKDRITSPGGTTMAGLQVLERSGVRGVLMDVVEAATRRADELGG